MVDVGYGDLSFFALVSFGFVVGGVLLAIALDMRLVKLRVIDTGSPSIIGMCI